MGFLVIGLLWIILAAVVEWRGPDALYLTDALYLNAAIAIGWFIIWALEHRHDR